MNKEAYRERLRNMELLTRAQRKDAISQLNAVKLHNAIIDEIEKNNSHKCPHCQSERLGRWGSQ